MYNTFTSSGNQELVVMDYRKTSRLCISWVVTGKHLINNVTTGSYSGLVGNIKVVI